MLINQCDWEVPTFNFHQIVSTSAPFFSYLPFWHTLGYIFLLKKNGRSFLIEPLNSIAKLSFLPLGPLPGVLVKTGLQCWPEGWGGGCETEPAPSSPWLSRALSRGSIDRLFFLLRISKVCSRLVERCQSSLPCLSMLMKTRIASLR